MTVPVLAILPVSMLCHQWNPPQHEPIRSSAEPMVNSGMMGEKSRTT